MSDSTALKILVLMGGNSSERDISLSSGKAVLDALNSLDLQAEGFDLNHNIDLLVKKIETSKPHVVFNALHGPLGEDGAIQGLLELLAVPYTHSGVMASAIGMNKEMTRKILQQNGLPVAKGKVISPEELKASAPFSGKYVIKPIEEGSSYGVYILSADENERRVEIAQEWKYGNKILVEEFIPGLELTVGVINEQPLGVTEIRPMAGKDFYDFEAKYASQGSTHIFPAPIDKKLENLLKETAVKAHKALECRSPSRCDFRYDPATGKLGILELNTQPGMTATSLLPEQAKYNGISFPKLCLEISLEPLRHLNSLSNECISWSKLAS